MSIMWNFIKPHHAFKRRTLSWSTIFYNQHNIGFSVQWKNRKEKTTGKANSLKIMHHRVASMKVVCQSVHFSIFHFKVWQIKALSRVNMYEPCTLLRLQSYRHWNVIQRLTDWSLYTRVWPVSPGKYMYASQPTNISHRPSSPVSLATKTHKEYKLWCLHRHGFITMHPSDVSRRASSSCEYSIEVSHTANSLWHYYKTRLFSML